jgi:hypothetical protein
VIGSEGVPLELGESCCPYQLPPAWKRICDPGAKVVESTFDSVCHGELGEVPLLLSLPVGLT